MVSYGDNVPFEVAALHLFAAVPIDETVLTAFVERDEALPAVFLKGLSHRRPAPQQKLTHQAVWKFCLPMLHVTWSMLRGNVNHARKLPEASLIYSHLNTSWTHSRNHTCYGKIYLLCCLTIDKVILLAA